MTNTEYAKLNVDVVLNIRKLAEFHLKNNPEMSSGTVVELLMEGIEQDVFDGWDPDHLTYADKQDINMKETLTDIITVLTIVGSVIIAGTFIGGYVIGLMLF